MFFNDSVWRGVDASVAKPGPDGKILNGRWVLSNKVDVQQPDGRARYVACEVHTFDSTDFFAATPPLEAKRLLFSQFASERTRRGQALKLHFADARKAYFNGTPTRNLYLRLPKELGLPANVLGRLVKC